MADRPAESETESSLADKLNVLFAGNTASISQLQLSEQTLLELGFEVTDGIARIPEDIERLDAGLIEATLSERARGWITDLQALQATGSTNTLLSELAAHRSVHGLVRLAELQLQGRGRRGRSWISPYGNNLAVSLGASLPQSADLLGGFSLCIGLAVADCLQLQGIEGIELKWPNDVLIRGSKIAGILIELHPGKRGTEVVVGIGINFHLPNAVTSAIDQPATDLRSTGKDLSRNKVAAGLISCVVDFIEGFATHGFPPMKDAFNALHAYQNRQCRLILGEEKVTGAVRGVGDGGELLLERNGRIETYNSGEVSLRPF